MRSSLIPSEISKNRLNLWASKKFLTLILRGCSSPPLLGPLKLTLVLLSCSRHKPSPYLMHVSIFKKDLHQIFNQFSHFSEAGSGKEARESHVSRGERLPALGGCGPCPVSSDAELGSSAKLLPLSQKHSAHTLAPPGLSPTLPALIGVFFKVNPFPFLGGILVPTINKITFLWFVTRDAPLFILGPLGVDSRRFRVL